MRRGTAMLAMLVVVLVGGLLAARLIPSVEIQQRRQNDVNLKFNLSLIRQAFDLKWQIDASFSPDLSNRFAIASCVASLTSEGLLSTKDLQDMTIPPYRWGLDEFTYWRATGNLASNTSFEDYPPFSGWASSSGTIATTTPGMLSGSQLDDYKGQNKMGRLFSNLSNCIVITK